jgi:hypothetical protein
VALAGRPAAAGLAKGAAAVMAHPRDLARRVLRRADTAPLQVTAPAALLEYLRHGEVALSGSGGSDAGRMRVAAVVPQFRRGSGGHSTIMHLLRGLEARGHTCSVWIEDTDATHAGQSPDDVEQVFRAWFGGLSGDVHAGFAAWRGADVVLATGWQTVYRVLRLDGARARGYLVQDHEPEFYGTSAERMWAESTYALGLPVVAASPWLAALVRDRYGSSADAFDLGIDHGV